MKKEYQTPTVKKVLTEEGILQTSGELFTLEGSYQGQSVDWNDNWN